jgi:ferritin-like metal-binding protein YciE
LRETYGAEQQLMKALSRMAGSAASTRLRDAFEAHLEETRLQVRRLDAVFASLGQKPRGARCDGIAGIIGESRALTDEGLDRSTLDACLIAASQRAAHYAITAYGTLIAWARAMGHAEAVDLLEQTLNEEKAAERTLTLLGDAGINQGAAQDAATVIEEAERPAVRKRTGSRNDRSCAVGMR